MLTSPLSSESLLGCPVGCHVLMSSLPCSYAVFGLGNKTYEHYNAIGRYVDQRLAELGAQRVFQLGEGDDDGKWVWSHQVM